MEIVVVLGSSDKYWGVVGLDGEDEWGLTDVWVVLEMVMIEKKMMEEEEEKDFSQ